MNECGGALLFSACPWSVYSVVVTFIRFIPSFTYGLPLSNSLKFKNGFYQMTCKQDG